VGGVKHPKSPRFVVLCLTDNLGSFEDMHVFITTLFYNGGEPRGGRGCLAE